MQSVILYSLEKNRKTVKECSYLTEKPSHSFYWSILSKELQNQSTIGRLRETIFFRYGSKSYSRHINFWKKDVFVLSRACNKEKSRSPHAEFDYRFLLRPTVLCLTLNPNYALWKKTQPIVYLYTDNTNEFIISSESLVACQELLIEKLPTLYLNKAEATVYVYIKNWLTKNLLISFYFQLISTYSLYSKKIF